MLDEYQKRIHKHNDAVREVEHELMRIAQRLCPGGHWMLQVEARWEYIGKDGDGKRIEKPVYQVFAHNGDDSVTAQGKTLGAAAALLIHYFLNGSVYPLTGNGGRFSRDVWEKDIIDAEDAARQEGMKGAALMAYKAAQGATREACAILCERRAEQLEGEALALRDEMRSVDSVVTMGRAAEAARLCQDIRGSK
jgi:hypothetical protein